MSNLLNTNITYPLDNSTSSEVRSRQSRVSTWRRRPMPERGQTIQVEQEERRQCYYFLKRNPTDFTKISIISDVSFLKDNIFSFLDPTSVRFLCSVNTEYRTHYNVIMKKLTFTEPPSFDYIKVLRRYDTITTLHFNYSGYNTSLPKKKILSIITVLKKIINENRSIEEIVIHGNCLNSPTTFCRNIIGELIDELKKIKNLTMLYLINPSINNREKECFIKAFNNKVVIS